MDNSSELHAVDNLSEELQRELEQNILPFWLHRMTDRRCGGFLGRIDGGGNPVPDAEKGAVLNARILWAFSAAYRILHGRNTWRQPHGPETISSTVSSMPSRAVSSGAWMHRDTCSTGGSRPTPSDSPSTD